jgi:hypothetical protein
MVSYDLMQQQIKRETSGYIKDLRKEEVNVLPVEMSYKQGKITLEFKLKELERGEFLSMLDIMKGYYSEFSGLETYIFGRYEVKAELKKTWFEKFKGKEAQKNQIKFSVEFDKFCIDPEKPGNRIMFEKEEELSQEEINCFLDIWKKYARKQNCEGCNNCQVIDRLADLGAIIYDSNQDFTWDSIAGYEAVKKEVNETIILPFKHPEVYKKINEMTRVKIASNIPRAVLFEGAPGTGKTTMARIIANESGLPLIYVPIESIMSKWYGVSEKKLAYIFDDASKLEKSILFLDEIDSLAGSREDEMHEATRRILSVLLRKMQGFMSIENVLTLGATNRMNDLDHALISRFNRTINFPIPNQEERKAIFKHYAKHLGEEELFELARETEKKSGRDIEDICGDSERMWAGKLISEGREVSPPTLESYKEALKFKFCTE